MYISESEGANFWLSGLTDLFKNLFLDKAEAALQNWLGRALNPDSELKGFAKGVQKDFDAVNQAVINNITNGQVEGQVNKLKTIKRMSTVGPIFGS